MSLKISRNIDPIENEIGEDKFVLDLSDHIIYVKSFIDPDDCKEIISCLDNKDLDKFLENINIIEKDLISIFEKNRIKKIDTNKKRFDPNFHQAMSEIEDEDKNPGTILNEIQAGYMLGDRLLRPALVSVSKKKDTKDQENEGKKDEN